MYMYMYAYAQHTLYMYVQNVLACTCTCACIRAQICVYCIVLLLSAHRDLANDVLTLMSSSKPYLRKKGILTMYKVFTKFPDALRPAFPRLKERLEDPDPGEGEN